MASEFIAGRGRTWTWAAVPLAALALAVVACAASGPKVGASSASSAAGERIRTVVITGNKAYEREPFEAVFQADPQLDVTHLQHSGTVADAWSRVDLEHADAIVLYDMPRDIDDAQKQRFLSIFERGIGLVVMHHALVSFQQWPEYERIVGGRYVDHDKGGDRSRTASGYQHDVDIPVQRVAPAHPVNAGVVDFTIHDEIYWNYQVGSDVVPLLRTTHPKSGNPLAWARTEQKSKVVYLLLGHGPSAYQNASYRRLVANAIRHVSAQD